MSFISRSFFVLLAVSMFAQGAQAGHPPVDTGYEIYGSCAKKNIQFYAMNFESWSASNTKLQRATVYLLDDGVASIYFRDYQVGPSPNYKETLVREEWFPTTWSESAYSNVDVKGLGHIHVSHGCGTYYDLETQDSHFPELMGTDIYGYFSSTPFDADGKTAEEHCAN